MGDLAKLDRLLSERDVMIAQLRGALQYLEIIIVADQRNHETLTVAGELLKVIHTTLDSTEENHDK